MRLPLTREELLVVPLSTQNWAYLILSFRGVNSLWDEPQERKEEKRGGTLAG